MQHDTQTADAGKRPVLTSAQSHLVLPVGLPVPPAVQVSRGQGPEPVGGSATQCKGAAIKNLQGSVWDLLYCCKDASLGQLHPATAVACKAMSSSGLLWQSKAFSAVDSSKTLQTMAEKVCSG